MRNHGHRNFRWQVSQCLACLNRIEFRRLFPIRPMLARTFNRFFWSAVTLLGTAVLTFLLVNAVPGDVARVIAGPKASPDVIKAIHTKFHLDEPIWKRL